MKQSIGLHQFQDAFKRMGRETQFSRKGLVASIMFHCGAIRAVTTQTNLYFIFKFKYADDFYSVIFPSKMLESDDLSSEVL